MTHEEFKKANPTSKHVHDPANPHPFGTGAYWQWHRKNHPEDVAPARKPQNPFAKDLAAREKLFGERRIPPKS